MKRPGLIAIALWVAGIAISSPRLAFAQPVRPSADVTRQIGALLAEKASRSPAQRKISSRLLYAAKMRAGLPIAVGGAALRNEVPVAADGTVLVDLRANVTPHLLSWVEVLGGSVVNHFANRHSVRARIPLDRVEDLAALPEVLSVQPADRAYTRSIDSTEGDVAHRADQVRAELGVDGTGVTIGVLSDGVDSLASLQASGDLPPGVTVLPGQAGSGSEGTAILEILFDLAPGADLMFATAFGGQAAFATNIILLRKAGADIIVDDVGYFAEAVFQDENVASAVEIVTADGALYFASAGNSGNLNDGSSGVWEGDFAASGSLVNGDSAHDFGGGEIGNEVTVDTQSLFTLHWSDPQNGSANDYDLFLMNKPMTVIFGASTNVQDGVGADDPFEAIGSAGTNDRGRKLVVVKSSGADRFLHLNANRGELELGTDGQTGGHSSARSAFSVAAVDVRSATGGIFDGSESVQTYSSDGPRIVFYEADGSAITPGNFSSSGGEVRQKPDLAAADCVSTATPSFATFCGTSAAAPHAAGIAALLLEVADQAGATVADVEGALVDSALDIEAAGVDRDSGYGIVDAYAAAQLIPEPEAWMLLGSGALFLAALQCLRTRESGLR